MKKSEHVLFFDWWQSFVLQRKVAIRSNQNDQTPLSLSTRSAREEFLREWFLNGYLIPELLGLDGMSGVVRLGQSLWPFVRFLQPFPGWYLQCSRRDYPARICSGIMHFHKIIVIYYSFLVISMFWLIIVILYCIRFSQKENLVLACR